MRRIPALVCALVLLGPASVAQEALSPSNASYRIEAVLDPARHSLEGTQVLTWTNLQEQPTDELWFHLYWNAWRNNRSTWMREDRLRGRNDLKDKIRPGDWSWMEVDTVRWLRDGDGGPVELGERTRHAWPDDGNEDDRTVLVVSLPESVEPGQTVRIEMSFRARVPRTFARTGYRGDTYLLAHWYPILGVLEPEGWNCHQFHSSTEFYSDYGSFDVRMTVPSEYVVGATGREIDRSDNADGTSTYRYTQDDVHNFAWTASPRYLVRESTFQSPGLPPVEMRLLLQPEHEAQAERYFDATAAALEHYGNWFGPYPYGHVTVVDPAYGAGHGGMEYPTFFTGGSRLFSPFGGDQPESVTIHEAGHQFWYGLVGNNEFEHAWIDEGLNTYSTLRTLDVVYGDRYLIRRYLPPPGAPRRNGRGLLVASFPSIHIDRWQERVTRYRGSATSDVPATESYLYFPGTGGDLTYSKTALWLRTLENYLGWERFQPIMAAFFERGRFAHPTPDDFIDVAQSVSGEDLGWFFDEVFRSDAGFDYAVASAVSDADGLEGNTDGDGTPMPAEEPGEDEPEWFRTEVVVQRRGAGRFPVEVLLVFEDGEEIREAWDGQARWRLFVHEGDSRLSHAVVDPDHILALDLNRTNNSRIREPESHLASRKWGGKWMIWFQDLLQTFAFFG